MKSIILFIFTLSTINVSAQKTVTLNSDSGTTEKVFFKNGKVSTVIFKPKIYGKRGYAKAFKTDGAEIFSGMYGYLGGSHGVDFTYYESGAAKSIRETFQPDGGIQHYDVIKFYDEHRNLTGSEDRSLHMRDNPLTSPQYQAIKTQPVKSPTEKIYAEEQAVPAWDCYFTNKSRSVVTLTVFRKNSDHCELLLEFKPGEKKKGLLAIQNQIDNNPLDIFIFKTENTSKKTAVVYKYSKALPDKKFAHYWEIK